MSNAEKYTLRMRVMHWLLAIGFLGMIAIGAYMSSIPSSQLKWELYHLHKSSGVLIFALVVIRIMLRFSSKIPPLPGEISKLDKLLSASAIFLMYVCMLCVPLSGYIASSAGGLGVPFFAYKVPNIFSGKNAELYNIANYMHQFLAYSLLGIACLHILAPFKHAIYDKVNILRRII